MGVSTIWQLYHYIIVAAAADAAAIIHIIFIWIELYFLTLHPLLTTKHIALFNREPLNHLLWAWTNANMEFSILSN